MRWLVPFLLLASTASAERRPTFMATTSYEHCQESTAFACNRRDANGNTYGTAHTFTTCERIVFQPDGTFTRQGGRQLMTGHEGTYRIFAGKVKMRFDAEPGLPSHSLELALSPDGTTLGSMKRIVTTR